MKSSTISIIIGVIIIGAVAFFALSSSKVTAPSSSATTLSQATSSVNPFTATVPEGVVEDGIGAETPTPAVSMSEVTIAVDEMGFTPATVTIAPGTTVTFVNNGQANHWPASDPHPTHTNLSGFDAEHGLTTGEKFSFTFTKAGTFGLHDHLNPRLKGSIVVR